MPKMKSCKSALKRFSIKKTRIKRKSAFRSHILTKKDAKRCRSLRAPQSVHSADVKSVKLMLCAR